ncbi:MAG: helix-turn-helix transcriptional regulator [Caulobacteraceae bacterium]
MSDPIRKKIERLWAKFRSKAFREGFVSGELSTNVAAQIVTMREDRGWTQTQLATATGMAQSRISLLEDPSYEKMSVTTLKRLASAFDVGLAVRFVPFSDIVSWAVDDAPNHLSVQSFASEHMPNRANRGIDWVTRAMVYMSDPKTAKIVDVSPPNSNQRAPLMVRISHTTEGERVHACQ